MRPTLIDVVKYVAYKMGIISEYSETVPSDKKTEIIEIINSVKEEIAGEAELSSLLAPFKIKTVTQYITGTVSIDQGEVAVTGVGTVFTTAMVGRKIQIGSDETVYFVKTYVSPTAITIDDTFLGDDESGATFVILQDVYDAGVEVLKIISMANYLDKRTIVERTAKWIKRYLPNPTDYLSGDVVVYGEMGVDQSNESVTVAAATTKTVTGTSLAADKDNFYTGWYAFNETQGKTVRVASSILSTGVVTYDQDITGQTASDTITLKKISTSIIVRYTPNTQVYMQGTAVAPPMRMINDNDLEVDIPEFYSDRALKLGSLYYYKLTNDNMEKNADVNKLLLLEKKYDQIKKDIKQEEIDMPNRRYQFGGTQGLVAENPFLGALWPRDQD